MSLTTTNPVIEDIVHTIEQMSEEEQKFLLTKLRIQNLLSGKKKPTKVSKKVKPLTLKEIDRIKHEARKAHEGK